MGLKIDLCSCLKQTNDFGFETGFYNESKYKIQEFSQPNINSIEKVEFTKTDSLGPELSENFSQNEFDSIYLGNNSIKFLLNKKEIIIQSFFRGYIYRKKFYETNGVKDGLVFQNDEIIKKIENNFIPNFLSNCQKFFPTEFEDNWKKYYTNKEINKLFPEKINEEHKMYLKTKCLLSKYKEENCLFKGSFLLDSFRRDGNFHIIKSYNINNITGKGVIYSKIGEKYEGRFVNGELNGWGRYINNKGIYYEGLFINGILNGKGEIIKLNDNRRKSIYKGDIKDFKKEGKGEEKTIDYNYEGEFKNGLKHGKGKIYFHNKGDFYEGEFENDEITGKGFFKWKNEHTYFGDFVRGKMHGKGLYKWVDGNQYQGEYVNNIKEGQGEFKWKDGKIFKGEFKKGKPHGKGLLTIKGETFQAVFKYGKYIGEVLPKSGDT